jgi:hypothetical protein
MWIYEDCEQYHDHEQHKRNDIAGTHDGCHQSNFLVVDAGTPVAAFTARRELQAYLRRLVDTFINPLVCTFWGNQGPSIMTMSAALAE